MGVPLLDLNAHHEPLRQEILAALEKTFRSNAFILGPDVGKLEEQEIGIMLSIDEARKRFAAAEAELKQNIRGHEAKIANLKEREVQLRTDVKQAQDTVAEAREGVPPPQLKIYDRVAIKPGHPVCVPVNGARCGGCHLKVSANVELEARKLEQVTTCDQCGRIVYWAP